MITSNRNSNWPDYPVQEQPAEPGLRDLASQALQKSGEVLKQTFAGIPPTYLFAAFAAGLVVGWIAKKR